MRLRGPSLLAWLRTVVLAIAGMGTPCAAGSLVVHEWGTFTTHHGPDGLATVWSPLTVESDLPSFVYEASTRATQKNAYPGTVRMETPVLYFYADGRQRVSVEVGFPSGIVSEWYPRAKWSKHGIRWPRVTILPDVAALLRREDAPSHYYPARATDAAIVRRGGKRGQHEKFLFYRGVGTFETPVQVRLDGELVRIGVGPDVVERGLVFERAGDAVGFRAVELASGETSIPRPEPASDGVSRLEEELYRLLVAEGLYEREAQAMLDTWRDVWSEEGLRVLYIVPARLTDEVLPLSITPSPSSVVRVLVGRAEVLLLG